jgi:hypothetical protein
MAELQVIWLQSARIDILVDLIIMYTSITKTKQIINFGTRISMGVFGRVHNLYPGLYNATYWCLVGCIGC